jgi:hypothetical protein
MKTLLSAFLACLLTTAAEAKPKPQRLSYVDWQLMYSRNVSPEYRAFLRGEITLTDLRKWEAAVKKAMLDKYGEPLPPPEPPAPAPPATSLDSARLDRIEREMLRMRHEKDAEALHRHAGRFHGQQ